MASGALAASLTGQRAAARQREEERKEARAADTREVYRRDQLAAAQQRDQRARTPATRRAEPSRRGVAIAASPAPFGPVRSSAAWSASNAATSQPSPDDALAQVSAVVARARSAQRAANLAQRSSCFASARAVHTALVDVGRALAVATASYSRIENLRLDLEIAAHGGPPRYERSATQAAPVRKRQRTSDRLRATQSPEAQELAAPEPVPPSLAQARVCPWGQNKV